MSRIVRDARSIKIASILAALAAFAADGAEAHPHCIGKRAKFVGTRGDDVIRPKGSHREVIAGLGGDDVIFSGGGRDMICGGKGDDVVVAGPQPDRVRGGNGDDLLYGGTGPDLIWGGPGADTGYGDAGSDHVGGGGGPDRLFGGIVDDIVRGGSGDDLLVGGHGGDGLVGGEGADWMRGGANRDGFFGGEGYDTASFLTSTPTNSPGGRGGVVVDLKRKLASGEGSREFVRRIEGVVGSPFADTLIGNGDPNVLDGGLGDDILRGGGGSDTSRGGPGSDRCSQFEHPDTTCNDTDPRPAQAVATLDRHQPDPGLVVVGRNSDQPDRIQVRATRTELIVSASTPLLAGDGCAVSAGVVRCAAAPESIDYVSISGLGGDDRLAADGRFSRRGEIQLDGGPGNDRLTGSHGDDVLLAGADGLDLLRGGPGDDALISAAGRDALHGGSGNDQLVADDPCFGHLFDGGTGVGDIAGFGRASHTSLHARLGGKAFDTGRRRCQPTRIRPNNEVLEGTPSADVLIGDQGDDSLILGGDGSDVLEGLGGDDVLRGEGGRDSFYGGRGRDLLEAKDRLRDHRLDCGPGSDYVMRDRFDPDPLRCRPPQEKSPR